MSSVTSPPCDSAPIRAIVFREGDAYVAQCIEFDIAAQAFDLDALMDRLDRTVEAEFAACGARSPRDCIGPAPNYYHSLWESRSFSLTRVNVRNPNGSTPIEVALAKAA